MSEFGRFLGAAAFGALLTAASVRDAKAQVDPMAGIGQVNPSDRSAYLIPRCDARMPGSITSCRNFIDGPDINWSLVGAAAGGVVVLFGGGEAALLGVRRLRRDLDPLRPRSFRNREWDPSRIKGKHLR